MKNQFALLFTLLFCCPFFTKAQQSVNIKAKQDFKVIPLVNHQVELSKNSFKLMFHVKGLEAFCIAFTTDKDIYRSALGEADLEVMWFENTGMAEGLFNDEKTVLLSDEAPSYWFYSSITEHRFDKHPQGTSKEWTAERTIDKFYQVEEDKTYAISELSGPIYYVVYAPIYAEDYQLIDKTILNYGELTWK